MVQTSYTNFEHEKNTFIARDDALYREKHVSEVQYNVDLSLPKGEVYGGKITINFNLKHHPAQDLFLDFRGVQVAGYKVNGISVQGEKLFRNNKIYVPSHMLNQVGQPNMVEMLILNKYRKDGCGLHSFIDGQDGAQYLWTQFEADYANFAFPCFD